MTLALLLAQKYLEPHTLSIKQEVATAVSAPPFELNDRLYSHQTEVTLQVFPQWILFQLQGSSPPAANFLSPRPKDYRGN